MSSNLKAILKTSVPIVVDLGAQILMWTLETILVGHIALNSMARFYPGLKATGVDALTAVGNVVQIILYTCTMLLIFIFGATIIINKLLGSEKKEEANHFLGQTLFTALFAALGISAVWYFFSPFIFDTILGTSLAVTAIGVDYFRVISWFAPFVIMNFVAIGIVRGAGDTHLSMMTGLLVNGIHFVLALILIFGIWKFPELGVRGAAFAAGIGHTAGFILTYSVILRGRSVLTFNWSDIKSVNRMSIVKIVQTGTPITLEQLAWMTGMTIVIGFSNRLGLTAAAAHIVVLNFQRLFSILYQAFGMGALTLVGQRYGAEEHESARQTTRMFFWVVGGVVLFLASIIFLRAKYFVLVFTSDAAVVELCEMILKIAAFVQIPKALSYIYSFSLRGVGENRYPMYLAFIGILCFEVILGFSLAFTFGLSLAGLWIATGVDEIFKFSLSFKKFRRRIKNLTTQLAE